MENNKKDCFKILMFPWLAHGHVSPFLELAKKLTSRDFKVYLCSTRAILSSIKEESLVQLLPLYLPESDTLPASLHTTNGLPPHLMDTLKAAFEESKPDFERILMACKPDLLIYDALQPWAPESASTLNIPSVQFIANGVTMSAFMLHSAKRAGKKFPFNEIYYRDYEKVVAESNMKLEKSPINPKRNNVTECIERSTKIVLIKSIKEIESKYIDYLSHLCGKKVVPVGPLVPNVSYKGYENLDIIGWLNKKEKRSTVFVAFGSETFLKEEDRLNIARGLELSNVNFIWVIRSPKGDKLNLDEALPLGFLDRVGERGRVLEGWAPQGQILSHPSIGGFVSHCGWSSVLESMKFGVPIIAVPMHLDQPINARLVEHVGSGVEAVKDDNGMIQSKELAAAIKMVVKEESGEFVRNRVEILKENIEARGDRDIDEVAKELKKLCQSKRNAQAKRNARRFVLPWDQLKFFS